MSVLSGADALDPERRFGQVVAYPYSSNIRIENGQLTPYLSVMSNMSIRAATGIWLAQPPDRKLVIPGETLYEGLRNTTVLMACSARHLTADAEPISDLDLVSLSEGIKGRRLNNTYLQTEAVARRLSERGNGRRAILSALDYHLERVMWTADAYEIEADFVTAEAVLHAQGIDEYDKFLPVIAEGTRDSEKKVKWLTKFDRQGKIVNWLMRNRGGRLVDVVENEHGELEF